MIQQVLTNNKNHAQHQKRGICRVVPQEDSRAVPRVIPQLSQNYFDENVVVISTPIVARIPRLKRPSPPVGAKYNPFRAAVPLWGQIAHNLSGLSPKRDCGSKGVNVPQLASQTD